MSRTSSELSSSYDAEQFFRMVADGAQEWEAWLDLRGCYRYVSPSCLRFSGYPAENFTSQPDFFFTVVHPEDRENYRAHQANQLSQPPQRSKIEFRIVDRQGRERRLVQDWMPVFRPDGVCLGYRLNTREEAHHSTVETDASLKQRPSSESLAVRALINVPTDIFALLDTEGKIIFGNEAMAQRVKLTVDQLPGRLVWELYPPAHAAYRKAVFDRVLRTGRPERIEDPGVYGHYDSLVYPVRGKDGKIVQIAILARDIRERLRIQEDLRRAYEDLERRVQERTQELQAANRDLLNEIAMRLQAEEQLQRHVAHAEALARIATRANAHLDLKMVLETICEEVAQYIPYPLSAVLLYDETDDAFHVAAAYANNIKIEDEIPPTPRPLYEQFLDKYGPIIIIPDRQALPPAHDSLMMAALNVRTIISAPLKHEGDVIGALNVASTGQTRLPTDDEIQFLCNLADQALLAIVNARLFQQVAQGQAQLRALSERLLELQEAERGYLARELHDDVGQMLITLKLNLEMTQRLATAKIPQEEELLKALENLGGQVQHILDLVRDLSLDLRPAALDELGLLPALLDFFERFTKQNKIRINLRKSGLAERFPPSMEIAVFRIVQEALINVARHAAVDEVDVLLWSTPEILGVQIRDHGLGFDPQRVERSSRSTGLRGIRERAASYGGSLDIDSQPGRGACVTVEIPINRKVSIEGVGS